MKITPIFRVCRAFCEGISTILRILGVNLAKIMLLGAKNVSIYCNMSFLGVIFHVESISGTFKVI